MIDTKNVTVSASIEDTVVTIFGYTCPNCRVELSNSFTYDLTYSRANGYYEFYKIILPKKFTDLCIYSIDHANVASTPTCIAPPPSSKYKTNIGPVILAPTLNTSENSPSPKSVLNSTGYTIPNSTVKIYLYKDKDNALAYPVSAYSLPSLIIKSNKNGHYNFNLPTSYSSNYRLYSSVLFEDNFSPKSNTITYQLPAFYTFVHYFLYSLPLIILTLSFFLLKKKKIRFLPALYPKTLANYTKSIWSVKH